MRNSTISLTQIGGAKEASQNTEITACSYIYEFCIADCSWYSNSETDKDGDGIVTWKETKLYQMEVDDLVTGKPAGSHIPLVRCF